MIHLKGRAVIVRNTETPRKSMAFNSSHLTSVWIAPASTKVQGYYYDEKGAKWPTVISEDLWEVRAELSTSCDGSEYVVIGTPLNETDAANLLWLIAQSMSGINLDATFQNVWIRAWMVRERAAGNYED